MLGDIDFKLDNIKYRLFLCNPQKQAIAELQEAYNIIYSPRFMDIGELSFTIPYKIENEKNPNWDLVKGEYLIRLNNGSEDLGYFIIEEPSDIGSDIQIKNVRCFSSEFNLAQKRLRSYNVDSITLNDLMNDSENGVLKREAPSWTFIPTTDIEITSKFRSFDITDLSLWDFIITEVASSYDCLFLFDTLTNTITAERLENVGENKGLIISKDTFINSIQASMKFSDIITKLIVQGKDDTVINEYNILGTMYLLNYDNYRNTDYMSQSLRDALDAWYAKIDDNRAQYNIYLDNLNDPVTGYRKQLSDKQNDISDLKTELKIIRENIRIGLSGNPYPEGKTYDQWKSEEISKIGELETATNQYNNIAENINTTLDNMSALSNTLSVSDLSNFTEEQQKELDYFTKTDTYSNPYIFDPEELIDDAAEFFDKVNIPRTKFDIDSVDFLNVTEYQKDHSKLKIGDIINIEYNDFNIDYVKVRLTGYDHDEESNTLCLMFSNQNRYDDPYIEFIDGSYKAYNAGVTLDIERYKYNDFVENNKERLITFTESPIDVDVNPIETDDGLVADESGTYSRGEEDALNQMRMLYDRIIYTNDNWATEPYPMLSADGLQVIDSGKNIKIIAQVSDELLEDPYDEVKGFVIYKNINEGVDRETNPDWHPVFYADADGNLTLEGALKLDNGELIIDRYGIDPKYIKYFKNMFWNSSFELFNPINNIPQYWSGGFSDPDASFDAGYSMRLMDGDESYNMHLIKPEWYNDVLPTGNTNTRVSFYKKWGSVKVEVYDIGNGVSTPGSEDKVYTLYSEDNPSGTTQISFPYNDNWNPDRPTFWFDHYEFANTEEEKSKASIRVKFIGDGDGDPNEKCFIDAAQLEPDFTGSWGSFYSDGRASIASNPYGSGGGNFELYIQDTDPTLEHTVGFGALWIDTNEQADELDFFTVADRIKLDGISPEANKTEESSINGNILIDGSETTVYTHPTDSGYKHIPTGGSDNEILVYDNDGTAIWSNITDDIHGNLSGGNLHEVATDSVNGFMSSSDKDKLDNIDDNANNYIHPDTHPADMITVEDDGGYFTSDNVEDILQEVGSELGEAGVPDGGVENDILVKQSAVDGDVDWVPSGTAAFEDMSRDGGIVSTALEADRLVTVGDGGDYATLQEAFDGEAHWISAGYEIEVRMLSGFEISTGVQLDAGNFRHFRLTGEDAVHDVIDGFTGHVIVFNDVIGFTLGVLIDMKGEGGDGIRAVNANFVVNEDCGVINAGDFGIRATTSNFRAVGSNFHGSTNRGVNCVQLCNGNVNNADLEGAGDHGLRVQAMSIVSANNTMCRRGEVDTDNDVFITDGGIIQFGLGGRTGGTNVPVNELTSAGFILQ